MTQTETLDTLAKDAMADLGLGDYADGITKTPIGYEIACFISWVSSPYPTTNYKQAIETLTKNILESEAVGRVIVEKNKKIIDYMKQVANLKYELGEAQKYQTHYELEKELRHG